MYFENKLSDENKENWMAYTTKAAEYLRGGGASNDEMDFFL